MLFDDAITMLEGRLGQRPDLTETIKTAMQYVQDFILEVDHVKFDFQLSENQNLLTVFGDDRISLPAGFLAEYEEGGLFLIRANGSVKPLYKEDLEPLINKYGDTQSEPVFYAKAGQYLRVYPIPDKVYTLRFMFYKKADALTLGQENHWLKYAADWLIAETGKLVAVQTLMNTKLAETFTVQANDARRRLWVAEEASRAVNRDMIKGV